MHSLKNTVVAVGLLGLSFLFYQTSSKPTVTDDDLLVPVLEVSEGVGEGLVGLVNGTTESVNSKLNSAQASFDSIKSQIQSPTTNNSIQPKIELPKLPQTSFDQSKQTISNLANNVTNKAGDFASEMKASAHGQIDNAKEVARSNIDSLTNKLQSAIPSTKTNSQSIQLNPNSTSNAAARDQGLINALNTQNLSLNESAENNFSSANQFVSQPMNGTDSSFNQLAGNESANEATNLAPANTKPDYSAMTFRDAWTEVDQLVAGENFHEALRLLTRFYRDTSLTGPQRQRLIGWLDALAGKVIFSAENHLVSEPHTVANGEHIKDISMRWNVPAQLIFNVNQNSIQNIANVAPGTQLKQIPGPFSAEINLQQKTMTLFLGELYAGRYPIRIGISGIPRPGQFDVMVKSEKGHSWRDAQGQEFPIGSPQNGYGPHWIGLSGSLCIHAVNDSAVEGHFGCIGLKESDAKDVFAILGTGSQIQILQ